MAVGDAERGDELLVESHRGGGLLQRGDEVARRARVGGTSGGRRDARANARHDGNGRVHSRVPRRLEVVRGGTPIRPNAADIDAGRAVSRARRGGVSVARSARDETTLFFSVGSADSTLGRIFHQLPTRTPRYPKRRTRARHLVPLPAFIFRARYLRARLLHRRIVVFPRARVPAPAG